MKLVDLRHLEKLNLEFNSYDELCEYYKQFSESYFKDNDFYYEAHHIIPRSEGGTDNDGIIYIDYFHHIMAHFLRGKEWEEKGNPLFAWKNYNAIEYINSQAHIKNKPNYDLMIQAKQKRIELQQQYGLVWLTNGKENTRVLSIEAEKYLENGWKKGRTFKTPKDKVWISDGENKKLIKKEEAEEFLKENPNWFYGMGKCKEHKIKNHESLGTTRGKIWVHKGTLRKNILPEDLESYLNQGWEKGSGSKPNQDRIGVYKGDITKNIEPSLLQQFLDDGWNLGRPQWLIEKYKKYCGRKKKIQ